MKKTILAICAIALLTGLWLMAQPAARPAGDPVLEGFRLVEVASIADAVVVGSALSSLIEEHASSPDLVEAVGKLVGTMKAAMREAPHTLKAAASS